ncbi:hypothetical protein JCM2421_19860 [Staphylococcus auricularis]|nr:hypothetical protein JCM2421_19860 [Staphylococcus auricularis]
MQDIKMLINNKDKLDILWYCCLRCAIIHQVEQIKERLIKDE